VTNIELALLNDAPRAATVRALSHLKVAKLDKRAFQRLLGPIKEIMARKDYNPDARS
jgi:cAMP-dependent protein kinase regulator